jgi:hypothetical protein
MELAKQLKAAVNFFELGRLKVTRQVYKSTSQIF